MLSRGSINEIEDNRYDGFASHDVHLNGLRPNATRQARLEGVGCSRLILIEAPSSAYPGGMLRVGNITR
jgi:hypothetical protein